MGWSSKGKLVAVLAIYLGLLFVSNWLLSLGGNSQGVTGILLALLPVPAIVAAVVIGVRQYQALDELMQRVVLTALSVSFLGTTLITFSWGFLEGVGVPRLSGFVVFAILVVLYLASLVWARSRYR